MLPRSSILLDVNAHLARHARVVAAVDAGTDDPVKAQLNDDVIELAAKFASQLGGTTTLFHAWRPFSEELARTYGTVEQFSEYLDRARLRAQWRLSNLCRAHEINAGRLRMVLERGEVEAALPRFVVAESVALVVIGSTGRGGLARRFRGSTAERLIKLLPCSTLVVKPETLRPAA